ncbi:MAG: ABC-2 family transporter protein [Chlamydiales bacterium]|nr:ABC-2 family transporter protein [Chlamydiales bacterium]
MSPYLAIFNARARLLFQYRAAAFAGIVTQVFWGYMRVMVFAAFYASASGIMPLSLSDTITYIWLSQVLLSQLPWNIDKEIEQMVRTGTVVYELVKPIDLYRYWYCRCVAMRLIPLLLRGSILILVAGIFFGLARPESLAHGLLFVIALVGCISLSAAVTVLVMISLFWTVTGDGILRLLPAIMLIFTGMLVPLPFFPEWFQPALTFLPFRAFIDTPLRLYMGNIALADAPGAILHQWIWVALLVYFGLKLIGRAQKKLVVHGG